MLHLDLKPENIFMVGDPKTGFTLKVGDFGTAVTLGQWDDEDGDPMYLAPELLRGEAGPPADVFSLGLIYYAVLTGCEMPNGGEEWQRLRGGEVQLPQETAEWQRCLLDMIQPEPRSRPSAREVLSCLENGLPLSQCKEGSPGFIPPPLASPVVPQSRLDALEERRRFEQRSGELDELNEGFSRSMSLSPLRGGFTSDDEDSDL